MSASVNSLFFDAVKTAAGITKVALPNIPFDPSALESYYQVFIIPAMKRAKGISSYNEQRGICQVSCFVKNKVGEINAVDMAETMIAAFPRGTKLTSGTLKVEINFPAYYGQGLTNNNMWYMVPVTIPYMVLT